LVHRLTYQNFGETLISTPNMKAIIYYAIAVMTTRTTHVVTL